ncbi:MAG TPA: hypothetical protein ENI82_05530 [Bacteroidetes bacterium]|nr:hypothetical protein [Bacteroidota bacterium]
MNGLHPAVIDKYTIYELLTRECARLESISSTKIKISGGAEYSEIILSKKIKLNIFRIFQECVSNAIKHGGAKTIEVFLSIDKYLVLMDIQDDGCGYQLSTHNKLTKSSGLGFISLHERVALLNGQIDFESSTDKGFNVRLVLPLDY